MAARGRGNFVSDKIFGKAFAHLPAITLCSMFAFNEKLISPSQLVRFLYDKAPSDQVLDGLLGLNRYVEVAQTLRQQYGVLSPNLLDYLSNPQGLNIVFTSRYFQILGDEAFDETYKFIGPSVAPRPETGQNEGAAGTDIPFDQLGTDPLI